MKEKNNKNIKKTWTEEEKQKLRYYSRAIRNIYLQGEITREEAEEELKEFIEFYNETSKRIAKKYDRKPDKFCFDAFMSFPIL